MALQEEGLDLTHGVEGDANGDEATRTAEEARKARREVQLVHEQVRHQRDGQEEEGSSERQPGHHEVKELGGGLARANTDYVAVILL